MQSQEVINGNKSSYILETTLKCNQQSDLRFGRDQKDMNKKLVIKIYHIEPTHLKLLKQISEQTQFKNVVNIIDIGQGKNSEYFIIMEYANQGDLERYLKNNKNQVNSSQRKDIMIQVSKGLQELHQQNFVHRNMSFDNILVFKENNQYFYKITDFDLLKQENITTTTRIGTPYYMAPELQKDYQNKYNYKSEVDIWALGCIFYELITQKTLFLDNNPNHLNKNWIDDQIDQIQDMQQKEKELLKTMISIDSKIRPKISVVLQTLDQMKIKIFSISQVKKPFVNIQNIPNTNVQANNMLIPQLPQRPQIPQIPQIPSLNQNKFLQPQSQPCKRISLIPKITPQQLQEIQQEQKDIEKQLQNIEPQSCKRISLIPKITPQQLQEIQQEQKDIEKQLQNIDSQFQRSSNLQNKFQSFFFQILEDFQQRFQLLTSGDDQKLTITQFENLKLASKQVKEQCENLSNQIKECFQKQILNYQSKLEEAQETLTQKLNKITANLKELKQLQTKTDEVNICIQKFEKSQIQYQQQLDNYAQLMQIKFDYDDEQIQNFLKSLIQEMYEIEQKHKAIENEYFKLNESLQKHKMDTSIIQLNKQKDNYKKQIYEIRMEMKKIIIKYIDEKKTDKTLNECEQILNEYLQEDKIEHYYNQSITEIQNLHQSNNQLKQSLISIDQDLQKINNKQIPFSIIFNQQQEDLERQFKKGIKYHPKNTRNYSQNKVILKKYIKDQVLIRQILQLKDQGKPSSEIKKLFIAANTQIQNYFYNSIFL